MERIKLLVGVSETFVDDCFIISLSWHLLQRELVDSVFSPDNIKIMPVDGEDYFVTHSVYYQWEHSSRYNIIQ